MANVSRPMGIRPVRYLNGSEWNGQSEAYFFSSSSNTTAAYIYDPVRFDTTNGGSNLSTATYPGVPAVFAVASTLTTENIRGVIVGFVPEPLFSNNVTASLGLKYRVASTARYAWVMDDYNVICEAESDATTALAATDINKPISTAYTAGSTVSGVSKTVLAQSTAVTNAAKPFRLLRASQTIGNEPWNVSAKWEVIINNSELQPGGAANS